MRIPFAIVLFPVVCVAYDILGVFPYPGGSHFAVFEPLMTGLAVKGHNVTVISHFPRGTSLANYEEVILDHPPASTREIFDMDNFKWWYRYLSMHRLYVWARLYCEHAFASPSMRSFLRANNRSYDVLVVEMFNSDCMLGLAHVYGAPFVGISSSLLLPFHHERIGNPKVGNVLLDVPEVGSFAGRLQTLIGNVFHDWFYGNVINAGDDGVVGEHLGGDFEGMSSVREIAKECSLILANQHFSLTAAKPQVPALVDVGGIHLKGNGRVEPVRINPSLNVDFDRVIALAKRAWTIGKTRQHVLFVRIGSHGICRRI